MYYTSNLDVFRIVYSLRLINLKFINLAQESSIKVQNVGGGGGLVEAKPRTSFPGQPANADSSTDPLISISKSKLPLKYFSKLLHGKTPMKRVIHLSNLTWLLRI